MTANQGNKEKLGQKENFAEVNASSGEGGGQRRERNRLPGTFKLSCLGGNICLDLCD